MTDRQQGIFSEFKEWVKIAHSDQVRKYTGEPYYNHLQEVCDILTQHGYDSFDTQMVAYGHDLLEDTYITEQRLINYLNLICDDRIVALQVYTGIVHLTDVYTHERNPLVNRASRKRLEAERLGETPHWIQTIKVADGISNTASIRQYDPGFWKVYREEWTFLLSKLTKASPELSSVLKQQLS